jgi:hypothetical protein
MTLVLSPLIRVRAQQAAQIPTPQWQIDAGGKLAFEAASVKQNTLKDQTRTKCLFSPSRCLTLREVYFSDEQKQQHIAFAYKLSTNQLQTAQFETAEIENDNRHDIQARAPGNLTQDQFRLMMQRLLSGASNWRFILRRDKSQGSLWFSTRQVTWVSDGIKCLMLARTLPS